MSEKYTQVEHDFLNSVAIEITTLIRDRFVEGEDKGLILKKDLANNLLNLLMGLTEKHIDFISRAIEIPKLKITAKYCEGLIDSIT